MPAVRLSASSFRSDTSFQCLRLVVLGGFLAGCMGQVGTNQDDASGDTDTLPGDGAQGGDDGGGGDSGGDGQGGADNDHGTPITPGSPTEYGTVDSGTVTTVLPGNLAKRFVNVSAPINGDAINISFNAIDGAKDYRIYELPADEAITLYEDGYTTAENTTYRCSGKRPMLSMLIDDACELQNPPIGCTWMNGNVVSFERTESDSNLGYVYPEPGPDRVPVYVLGRSDPKDREETIAGQCQSRLSNSTRSKIYTTNPGEREALLADRARDDGIAFWVPATASAATKPVYTKLHAPSPVDATIRLIWVDGPEATARGEADRETMFQVLKDPAAGTLPLYRVHVASYCGSAHDELGAGESRRDHIRYEGDQPINKLRYTGLKPNTVLVIEALDAQCPDIGMFSPEHYPTYTDPDWGHVYPEFETLEQLRARHELGEVFINGQGAAGNQPKAIARAFLRASPSAPATTDFFVGFDGDDPEVFTDAKQCDEGVQYECETMNYTHLQSEKLDVTFYSSFIMLVKQVIGELWTTQADIGADVNGLFRATARQKATVQSGSFLHVTGEMDSIASPRRYSQIIISPENWPVQRRLAASDALVFHLKDYGATWLQVQGCDNQEWDVNNQCPMLPTLPKDRPSPAYLPGELAGLDRTVKYDVYLSTERLYVFLDDRPYSCTQFPAKKQDGAMWSPTPGQVSVTWGSTLYHSGDDLIAPGGGGFGTTGSFVYMRARQYVHMRRHLDNLGFQNGVAGVPTWDDELYPCTNEF